MVPETTNIPALDPIGHITVVYGTATARSADGTRALSQGDPVYRGENIVTGPESSVEITFQDDTILSQSQNSRVDLDTYVFDPDTGAGDALLKLTQGAFRMATGAIVETNPDKFRVQSPLATIGIRGTDTGHVVPGAGSNQPENHSCLDYEGHPVVVQSNMGGPPQTLFGAGLGVPASPMGLGSIGALSGAQMAFFGTMTPGSMSQGPPSFSPPAGIFHPAPACGRRRGRRRSGWRSARRPGRRPGRRSGRRPGGRTGRNRRRRTRCGRRPHGRA